LGAEWIEVLSNSLDWEKLVIADPIELAQKIASILLPLNIPYVVGGSVASSLLGENRSTQDLDLVIDLEARIAPQLIDVMSAEFYISESAVMEAIAFVKNSTPRIIVQCHLFAFSAESAHFCDGQR
jgi:hypothetical protein